MPEINKLFEKIKKGIARLICSLKYAQLVS